MYDRINLRYRTYLTKKVPVPNTRIFSHEYPATVKPDIRFGRIPDGMSIRSNETPNTVSGFLFTFK